MREKLIFKLTILFLIFVTNCGYKAVNQSEISNFSISEIQTNGNKIVNFKLKNKLLFGSKKDDARMMKIDLKTSKNKTVKEKNIKNEITKYDVSISVNVNASLINNSKDFTFAVSKSGNYTVSDRHSITLRNEKKLIELLAEDISNEILYELRNK